MRPKAFVCACFILFTLFFPIPALLPSAAQALELEVPVVCREGVISEPIFLKNGDRTEGCQLETMADQDQFIFYGRAGDEVMAGVWLLTDMGRNQLYSLTVLGPSGDVILAATDPGVHEYQKFIRESVRLTETGPHLILFEAKDHNATAEYQLAFEIMPPMVSCPRLSMGLPVQNTLDGPADIDLYAFQGTAGSFLRIPVSFVSDSYERKMHVQIRDFKGDTVVDETSETSQRRGQNMLIELAPEGNGRYYLTVDAIGNNYQLMPVTYEVQIQCIYGTCRDLRPQPALEGCLREKDQPLAGVRVTLDQPGEPRRFKVTDDLGCYSFPTVVPDMSYNITIEHTKTGEAAPGLLPTPMQTTKPEIPVVCKEGIVREPIALKYGDLTDGCQFETITDQDQFSFYGRKGEEVMMAVGATPRLGGKQLLITVLSPTRSVVVSESTNACFYSNCEYWRKNVPLTETGTHFILIESKLHDDMSAYQLAIERVVPPRTTCPRLAYGLPTLATLDGRGDIDLLSFQASTGSLIHIPVSFDPESPNYFARMHVQVKDPTGVTVFDERSKDNPAGTRYTLVELPITESGRYSLTVDGDETSISMMPIPYEIQLQCIHGTCLDLRPQPALTGCLRESGQPLAGVSVKLEQPGEPNRFKVTDDLGCYGFSSVALDLEYSLSIEDTMGGGR